MNLLLLGMGLGLVSVSLPGPISLSLVQVATVQGKASGAKAAVGIVSGDVILSVVGIGVVTLGTSLPVAAFEILQAASALVVIGLGLAMVFRPGTIRAHASSVARPYRTFLALTTLVPSALGSWLALFGAMPFAANRTSLAVFASGVVAVSLVWHLLLGYGAGRFGSRLTPGVAAKVTRLGGLATVAFGLWALS